MKIMVGIASLLLIGGGAILMATWLSRRQGTVARAAGALLAACVAIFCAVVAFALIADNWHSGPSSLRVGGTLSLLAFLLVELGAIFCVARGRPFRGKVSSKT